jgi:hypothetical protein
MDMISAAPVLISCSWPALEHLRCGPGPWRQASQWPQAMIKQKVLQVPGHPVLSVHLPLVLRALA